MRFTRIKSFLICGGLLLLFSATSAYAVTWTSVKNGNWTDPCTWNAGPPGGPCPGTVPGMPIAVGNTVTVNHVVQYNLGVDINIAGILNVISVGPPAWLQIPTNIHLLNNVNSQLNVTNGRLLQCRFQDCDDGQPYTGTNHQGNQQNGVWTNKGGRIRILGSVVEVAQSWTSEFDAGVRGDRHVIDSCVFTGQNYQVINSDEQIIRSLISVGWHGSGNYQTSGSTNVLYDRATFQLAGTAGNFQQASSVTHNGDIDAIVLRNQFGNGGAGFIGGGNIHNDPGMGGSPVNLDAYCKGAGNYEPNGEFVGPQVVNCTLAPTCQAIVITAASVSVDGRVVTTGGRGIGGAILTISGGNLPEPLMARTNAFGYYSFPEVEVGQTYLIEIRSKGYEFEEPSRVIQVNDSITGLDFVAAEPATAAPTTTTKRKF